MRLLKRIVDLCLFAALFGVIVGCSAESERGVVIGSVTLDGEPLQRGLIRFVPIDGQTPTADAPITGGKFKANVPNGEKRVEITAPRVVGTKKLYESPGTPTVDIVEELLPARYNVQTKLIMTVAAGKQQQQFELSSGE